MTRRKRRHTFLHRTMNFKRIANSFRCGLRMEQKGGNYSEKSREWHYMPRDRVITSPRSDTRGTADCRE